MTNYPILQTKLNRPPCFPNYYKRKQLHGLLNKGLQLPLTLLSAGAGYGKSSLLNHWLEEVKEKHIWLSCDEDIDQPGLFVRYLIEGFEKQHALVFSHTLSLLNSVNEIPEITLINSFVSELNKLSDKTILVLDDFHLIKRPVLHHFIDSLIKHPIHHLHIYLLTRKDPEIKIQQYQCKQNLQKISTTELSFSRAETSDYAQSCLQQNYSEESSQLIARKTEGWIMGINLALNNFNQPSVTKTEDLQVHNSQLLNRFLKSEIIDSQPQVIQVSLFICASFKRFCGALLYHILDECHNDLHIPSDILQVFEQENFFLIPLDKQNNWFRFHHQFQDMLLTYLNRNKALHQHYLKAGSRWLAQNGFYEEATVKAIESEDKEFAIELFLSFNNALLNADKYGRFKQLLHLFPHTWISSSPDLQMAQLNVLQYEGKLGAMQSLIKQCKYFETDNTISGMALAQYYINKAVLLLYKGKFQESLELFAKGESTIEHEAEHLNSFCTFFKAQALSALGTIHDGLQFLNTTIDSLLPHQQFSKERLIIAKITLYKNHNDFTAMEQLLPHLIEKIEHHQHYEVLGLAYYFYIEILYRQNRFAEFNDYFDRAYGCRHQIRASWFIHIWIFKIFYLLKTHNDVEETNALNELSQYINELDNEEYKLLLDYILLEVALQKGDTAVITNRIEKLHGSRLAPERGIRYYSPRITYLKMLLHRATPESFADFHTIYAEARKFAEQGNNVDLLIQLKLLNVIADYKNGDTETAKQNLLEAIGQTSVNNDLLVFTEFGYIIPELLNSLMSEFGKNEHAQQINHLLTKRTDTPAEKSRTEKTYIPLKERDKKILELVAQGYKNNEIAEAMFLSPDSIKKYLYNIYRDLGVKNRITATLKAKELGLISKL